MVTRTTTIKASKVLSDEATAEMCFAVFKQAIGVFGKPETGLSDVATFWCISCSEGINQAGVANLVGVSQKVMSKIIYYYGSDGLGWIDQRIDNNDRRSKLLYLSKEGKNIRKQMVHALAKRRDELTAREGGVIE